METTPPNSGAESPGDIPVLEWVQQNENRIKPWISKKLNRLFDCQTEIADLTQDLYVIICKEAQSIHCHNDSQIEAWVRKTLRRLVMRRNLHKQREIDFVKQKETTHDELDTALVEYQQWEELCEEIRQSILQLPSEERDLILDHFFNKLTLQILAEQRSVSANLIQKKIKRICHFLQELLQDRM